MNTSLQKKIKSRDLLEKVFLYGLIFYATWDWVNGSFLTKFFSAVGVVFFAKECIKLSNAIRDIQAKNEELVKAAAISSGKIDHLSNEVERLVQKYVQK